MRFKVKNILRMLSLLELLTWICATSFSTVMIGFTNTLVALGFVAAILISVVIICIKLTTQWVDFDEL